MIPVAVSCQERKRSRERSFVEEQAEKIRHKKEACSASGLII
jgi:hypothetical protein